MELMEAIVSRTSAGRLTVPGPSAEHLSRLLQAADRAPDHGRLKPWRFTVLDADSRQRFVEAVVEARRRRAPPATEEQLQIERDKLSRSPTLIVAGCRVVRDNPKVPEVEQVIAVGAAVQNLFLAAHAMGFGVMWKTGPAAYDPGVKAAVGLSPEDHIVGILHLGTALK